MVPSRTTTHKQVIYDRIFVNIGEAFSGVGRSPTFSSPGKDIYLFTMFGSAQLPLNLTMVGLSEPMGLTHTSTAWKSMAIISRNIMSMTDKRQNITVMYIGVIVRDLRNSWGGFSVSGSMDPLVAFSVARYTSMTSQGLVSYDLEIINTGQFSMESSTFVVPLEGILLLLY